MLSLLDLYFFDHKAAGVSGYSHNDFSPPYFYTVLFDFPLIPHPHATRPVFNHRHFYVTRAFTDG